MTKWLIVVLALGVLCVLAFIPFLSDPYFHRELVDFWTWAKRELNELLKGEKE